MSPHLVVVGSGALARSICWSLATLASPPRVPTGLPRHLRVTVLARDATAAAQIARVAELRATVSGVAVRFDAGPLADGSGLVARLRPDVLVCCASTQSPYEKHAAPSAWTSLIARAGFGLTLPFQAGIVSRLARAIARESPDTLLVNACFPDAVNPLLAALGLPVHCGIGNVAIIAACLQATWGLPDQGGLAVLGHHVHLDPPAEPADEVRVWRHGQPMTGVTALLAADRALPRRDLNLMAGHTAAALLAALTGTTEVHANVPGPLGLPGGYPVRLLGRQIALDLPPGLGRADAISWNTEAGRRDGVEVSGGWIRYPAPAAAILERHAPDLADGWSATDLDAVTGRLTALRERLRLEPPVPLGSVR